MHNQDMAAKKRIQTSASLTEKAKAILQKYRGSYGVKNTLSVGLELFDALSAEEQRERTRISTEEDARARQAAKKADRIVRGAEADASTQRKSMRHSAG